MEFDTSVSSLKPFGSTRANKAVEGMPQPCSATWEDVLTQEKDSAVVHLAACACHGAKRALCADAEVSCRAGKVALW